MSSCMKLFCLNICFRHARFRGQNVASVYNGNPVNYGQIKDVNMGQQPLTNNNPPLQSPSYSVPNTVHSHAVDLSRFP